MTKIWKEFPFTTPTLEGDYANIQMPVGAEILVPVKVNSHGMAYVSAMIDPTAKEEVKKFFVVGSMWSEWEKKEKGNLKFIGDYEIQGLPFHFFEVI